MGTEQVPTVAYERAGMPKGEAQAANQATQGMSTRGRNKLETLPPEFQEAANEFVYSRPTDRPDVPVTNGMPFGPGASYVQFANEDESTMRERAANQLIASPSADEDVRRIAERIRRGE